MKLSKLEKLFHLRKKKNYYLALFSLRKQNNIPITRAGNFHTGYESSKDNPVMVIKMNVKKQ